MSDEIAVLRSLRCLDDELVKLQTAIRARESDLQRKIAEEKLVRDTLERDKAKLRETEARRRDANGSVEQCGQQKAHFQKQLMQVKTNIEYQALLREIATSEKRIRELEDIVLEAMEGEEVTKRTIAQLEGDVQAKSEVASAERTVLEADVAKARAESAKLAVARAELLKALRPQTKGKYERLREVKGDTAIVTVEGGSCQGCHYRLPPQVGTLLRGGEQIVFCEGCGRILVADHPNEASAQ